MEAFDTSAEVIYQVILRNRPMNGVRIGQGSGQAIIEMLTQSPTPEWYVAVHPNGTVFTVVHSRGSTYLTSNHQVDERSTSIRPVTGVHP